MGNKEKVINWDMIELHVRAGSKQIDICKKYDLDEVTLRERVKKKYGMDWSAFSAKFKSDGIMLLEATAYKKAISGHWHSLHWLLQTLCGQKIPENAPQLPANQEQIDQTHVIMQLQNEIAELKANDNKPQAE